MKGRNYWQAKYEGQVIVTQHLQAVLIDNRQRITELEDRLMAESLPQFKASQTFAMPGAEAEVDTDEAWGIDPTGLFREKLPALTPAEQRIADSLRNGQTFSE